MTDSSSINFWVDGSGTCTATNLAANYHDLIGEPGAGTGGGKKGLLNEKRAALGTARTTPAGPEAGIRSSGAKSDGH